MRDNRRWTYVVAALMCSMWMSGCDDGDDSGGGGGADAMVGGAGGGVGGAGGGVGGAGGEIGGAGGEIGGGGGEITPPATAQIRVVHAAAGAPAVDVYVQGAEAPALTDLSYTDTSAYLEVEAGDYVFELRPAGAGPETEPAFVSPSLTLGGEASITVIAAGDLGSDDEADGFRLIPQVEGFGAPIDDSARVRVVHAGFDAPAVGVDVGADGDVEIPELLRFTDTGAEGVPLPAGEALQVGLTTVEEAPSLITAFTTPALPSGADLFVIATGRVSTRANAEDGFGLLAVGPAGTIGFIQQNPAVYVLHAGPDAPAVDVFAGEAELIDDLDYGELSAPLIVPPGTYSFDAFGHAAGANRPMNRTPISLSDAALDAGERYLVVASGTASALGGGEPLNLAVYTDQLSGAADEAVIRAIHASHDAPPVDVGPLVDGVVTPVFEDLAYGEGSGEAGLPLPPGDLRIGVAAAGTPTPVAAFDLELPAGIRAFALATGFLSPMLDAEEPFSLMVVDTAAWPWTVAQVEPLAAEAEIRVVHAAPGAPVVDVYAAGDEAPAFEALGYGQASGYGAVPAGSYGFEVRVTGAAADSEPVYSSEPLELMPFARYTVIAAGLVGNNPEVDGFRLIALRDDFGAPVEGSARARVVHAGADAPTVGVDVGVDGEVEIPALDRFAETGPEGAALPADAPLSVGILVEGSIFTTLTTPALPEGGELYLIATGLIAEKPRAEAGFGLLAVGPDGVIGFIRQDPTVQVLHAGPNAPAIDVFAGDGEVIGDLAFGEISDPVQVTPGAYMLDVFAAAEGGRPDGEPVITYGSPALEAGERYLVVATGFIGDRPDGAPLQFITAAEGFVPPDVLVPYSLIRAIHAAPDAPAVDVGLFGEGESFDVIEGLAGIGFPTVTAAEGLEIVPGDYVLGVAAAGMAPFDLFPTSFEDGGEAFVLAAGALQPLEGEASFRLLVVDTVSWPWVVSSVLPRAN